jgi:uncharacterized protein (TIGR02118 family)
MRKILVSALVFAAACGPKADDAAEAKKVADSTAAAMAAATPAPPPAPAGPQAIVTVIYTQPKDAKAFEKYYSETHVPLVGASQAEVGFTKAELTKFTSDFAGKKPAYYRQAELYFPNMDALKKGTATEAFKKIGADLDNFAKGGYIALIATETGDKRAGDCPVLASVLYKQPKDAAAFEAYYPGHLKLVVPAIGMTGADLTKFESNLDGTTPAALYRQAELCFATTDDVKKGMATAEFKAVGADLPKFATGGLVTLIGEQK